MTETDAPALATETDLDPWDEPSPATPAAADSTAQPQPESDPKRTEGDRKPGGTASDSDRALLDAPDPWD